MSDHLFGRAGQRLCQFARRGQRIGQQKSDPVCRGTGGIFLRPGFAGGKGGFRLMKLRPGVVGQPVVEHRLAQLGNIGRVVQNDPASLSHFMDRPFRLADDTMAAVSSKIETLEWV